MFRVGTWLSAAFIAGVISLPATAATVQMLGDQDFVDGTSPVLGAVFSHPATQIGDPDPFNRIAGHDAHWVATPTGDYGYAWNPSTSTYTWKHVSELEGQEYIPYQRYDLGGSLGLIEYEHEVTVGTADRFAYLELGLADHDSFDGDARIAISFFDVQLDAWIAQDVSMWAGISTGDSSYHVRQMMVDLDLLRDNDGLLRVQIAATDHGTCVARPGGGDPYCQGNGIGIDFSTLVTDVPLPAAGLLLLAGLGGMATLRRRKSG